jgi:hypothetical protein
MEAAAPPAAAACAGGKTARKGLCESCRLKQPNFGLASEGLRRWCAGCARRQTGPEPMVDLTNPRCEDCAVKVATAGIVQADGTRVRKWCGGCSKAHDVAVSFAIVPKCEDCKVNSASVGEPIKGKRKRWCVGCAKAHPHCVRSSKHLCEDCRSTALDGRPFYCMVGDKRGRWCKKCWRNHPGSQHYLRAREKRCEACTTAPATYAELEPVHESRWCKKCIRGDPSLHAVHAASFDSKQHLAKQTEKQVELKAIKRKLMHQNQSHQKVVVTKMAAAARLREKEKECGQLSRRVAQLKAALASAGLPIPPAPVPSALCHRPGDGCEDCETRVASFGACTTPVLHSPHGGIQVVPARWTVLAESRRRRRLTNPAAPERPRVKELGAHAGGPRAVGHQALVWTLRARGAQPADVAAIAGLGRPILDASAARWRN